ncbi:MAG: hypothetical protein GY841_23855 [FCB group bacterium]|nr:hypothetical protein [FCB group bacterium]
MRAYSRLHKTGSESLKKRLIRQRGSVCLGCGTKRRNQNLLICVVDPEKESCDSNLALIDAECRRSLLMIIQMLYGRDKTGIEHLYDYRAGHGALNGNHTAETGER